MTETCLILIGTPNNFPPVRPAGQSLPVPQGQGRRAADAAAIAGAVDRLAGQDDGTAGRTTAEGLTAYRPRLFDALLLVGALGIVYLAVTLVVWR